MAFYCWLSGTGYACWYQTGLVPLVRHFLFAAHSIYWYHLSCTALPADIDGAASAGTKELTNALLKEFDSATLWDEYGVDMEIIPFTCNFPRADIHELISSDLLHQAIKGTFKDHLVEWVGKYLEMTYEKAEAGWIMDEIDRRYVCVLSIVSLV